MNQKATIRSVPLDADGKIGPDAAGVSTRHFKPNGKPMPPNIQTLIDTVEVELQQAISTRDKCLTEVEFIIAQANREGRANLKRDEDDRVTGLFATRDKKDEEIRGIENKLSIAKRVKTEERDNDQRTEEKHDTGARKPGYDRQARVGAEERTYHPESDPKGAVFLRDVAKQFLNRDPQADLRLSRHMQEERVERGQYLQRAAGDANTGAFTGLVVPQYLTEMYAPAVAALRPFADICNKHSLPADGMTVNISRITTSTSVALQATELAAVSATSIDDTLLTEAVQTAAGQQTMSRQAIDRGTGIEEIIMGDLQRRWATTLDSTLLNQATTGLSAIATANTWTDANPTGPELYPKILGAAAGVEAALLAQAIPTHAVMHSRRWYWLSSQLTSQWPMISQPGYDPHNMGSNAAVGYNKGIRGRLPNGLGVVVDNNIGTSFGTNEDEIYVVPSDECHLWEDLNAPQFIRAEQPQAQNLGVVLVLYGYFAYSFRRFANGMGKVSGSGLILPVF